MKTYILDTSVYSQILKPDPDPRCVARWREAGDAAIHIPAIVVAELRYGLYLKDSARLWSRYASLLEGRHPVLPFDERAADTFGRLKAAQPRSGATVDDFDLAIAATAVADGHTVATLNSRHFQRIPELAWEDWSA